MTAPYVFQISVVVLTCVWALYLRGGMNPPPRVTWQFLVICLVLGWVSSLAMEGFGVYGPYTGPEPHM